MSKSKKIFDLGKEISFQAMLLSQAITLLAVGDWPAKRLNEIAEHSRCLREAMDKLEATLKE